jgi:hypothetical protein
VKKVNNNQTSDFWGMAGMISVLTFIATDEY